jgi:branched-chain amino acid:cation transporter, LIVCS family
VLIALACLVTAVGLTCACAEYFSTVLPLSYKTLVIILALFSLAVSNLGLTQLIAFSIPVLTAIYPPCIVLVALSFCKGLWNAQARIVGPVMLVSFFFGSIDALKGAGMGDWIPAQLANMPFSEQGLAWLVPSLVTLLGAVICDRLLGKRVEAMA